MRVTALLFFCLLHLCGGGGGGGETLSLFSPASGRRHVMQCPSLSLCKSLSESLCPAIQKSFGTQAPSFCLVKQYLSKMTSADETRAESAVKS